METNGSRTENADGQNARRAPWWVYVGAIVAANYGRQLVVSPDEVSTVVNIALFAAVTLVVLGAVALGHRLVTQQD